MPRRWIRNLAYLAGISLLITAALVAIVGGVPARNFWSVFLEAMKGSFPIAFCIGGLSWLIMPTLAQRVGSWNPFLRWPVYFAALTATATAGTALAGVVYYYGFAVQHEKSYWDLIGEALRSSIPITWMVGSMVTIISTVTARLQATELSLRTQQWEKEHAQKLAAEAQLASLASRVQPHFLFNTLNSITALVRQNPVQAEILIERLASLLRSSLDGAQTVPLEQELKLVADYLEIQQARFGERLRYQLSEAPVNSSTVPPFAIQTIVENSLKHVAGKRAEGVAVKVLARMVGPDLVVDVTDDGPGFAEDSMTAGHGLENLQGRLRAVYGHRAGIEFLREAGAMTVRLRVPAL